MKMQYNTTKLVLSWQVNFVFLLKSQFGGMGFSIRKMIELLDNVSHCGGSIRSLCGQHQQEHPKASSRSYVSFSLSVICMCFSTGGSSGSCATSAELNRTKHCKKESTAKP